MAYSPILNPHPVSQSGAWSITLSGTSAVSGTFWQATQPVSIATMPSTPVTGTFWQATQPVSLTSTTITGTVAVTGTFFQATQPISAASLPLPTGAATSAKQPALGTAGTASTDVITVQGIASGVAQPVSGTFWQATQPVSGTVTVGNASLAVTGTFFQATQPVSGTVTVTGVATETTLAALSAKFSALGQNTMVNSAPVVIASNQSALPVTGAFFQATQPVSIAATVAVTGPLTDTQLRAAVVPVSLTSTTVTGTVAVTDNAGSLTVDAPVATPVFVRLSDGAAAISTLPVSIAGTVAVSGPLTDTQIRATPLPVSGTVTANIAAAQTLATVTTVGTVTTITNAVTVTPPTLTKGTQGATGFSTQDLKDAGRNQTNFFMAVPIVTTAAEVMQSMTGYKSGAAVGATVTPAVVTTGKTYRVTKIVLTYFNVATVGSARVNLRVNTAGVAVVGSPLAMTWQVGLSGDGASTAGHSSTYDFSFPDGLEFAAGTGIAFGVIGEGAVPTTATIVGYVLIQCFGFEY